MSLSDRINDDIKTAMKAGDALKRDTLRMLAAAMKNMRIEQGRDLDDAQCLAVVRSGVKSRRDSAEQFRKAERPELADKEDAEIAILDGYLPSQLDEQATRALVEAAIAETGAAGKAGIGQVMKSVMAQHRDVVDGKLVQRLAAALLA